MPVIAIGPAGAWYSRVEAACIARARRLLFRLCLRRDCEAGLSFASVALQPREETRSGGDLQCCETSRRGSGSRGLEEMRGSRCLGAVGTREEERSRERRRKSGRWVSEARRRRAGHCDLPLQPAKPPCLCISSATSPHMVFCAIDTGGRLTATCHAASL